MDSEPWCEWRTGTSKVKSTGWLEWTGADDFRSPLIGAIELVTSAPTDRGIWCNLLSAGRQKLESLIFFFLLKHAINQTAKLWFLILLVKCINLLIKRSIFLIYQRVWGLVFSCTHYPLVCTLIDKGERDLSQGRTENSSPLLLELHRAID